MLHISKARPAWMLAALTLAGALMLPAAHAAPPPAGPSTQPVYALHGFSGPDGSRPDALIQGADGNLYGTTAQGGTDGAGAVYRIAPDGTFTLLHSFDALVPHPGGGLADPAETNADGAEPVGLVRDGGGNLWGIAQGGGANGHGTLFEIPSGGAFRVAHAFSPFTLKYQTVGSSTAAFLANDDGSYPSSLVLGPDGNLYGTATGGGANGRGTVFRVTTGSAFSTLYTFSQTTLPPGPLNGNDPHNVDGAAPDGAPLVVGTDGALYGMTSRGGPGGLGTVFRLSLVGAFTVLSAPGNGFAYTTITGVINNVVQIGVVTGAVPTSLRLGPDGSLYGASGHRVVQDTSFVAGGGTLHDGGMLFHLSAAGVFTTLYKFPGYITSPSVPLPPPATGATDPSGLLQAPDGSFYGAARTGGPNSAGTVFRLSPDMTSSTGYSPKTLYAPVVDGAQPTNLLLAQDGNLYGTGGGGVKDNGVVFEVAPTPPTFVIHSFSGADGFNPVSLLSGKDGNLYGAAFSSTGNGRGIGDGTFFTLTTGSTPDNDTLKVLHLFGNPGPRGPNMGVVQAADGLFYGTTVSGYAAGSIYSIAAGGLFKNLYDFPGGGNLGIGGTPLGGIIQGPGGVFYGAAYNGSTVYSFVPGGPPTILHKFIFEGNGPGLPDDGTAPTGSLLLASDGRLYGTCSRGGLAPNSGQGTLYSIDPAAPAPGYGFRLLHRFALSTESGNPPGGLVEGKDGALYGTLGQSYYQPAVFKINKDGSGFQILHQYANAEGSPPITPLVLAGDGFFYGMVGAGGGGGGSIFRVSADGTDFLTVYRFSGPDGEDHYNGNFVAPLVQGPDGNLYGVAGSGGLYGYTFNPPYVDGFGTIFRLATARPNPQVVAAAKDVTGQVALHFTGHTLVAGVHTYALTLTNTGGALPGPLFLALDNLPAGTALLNAGGSTNQAAPAGSPFVAVTGGGLASGATTGTLQLKLNKPLTPATVKRILSGPGAI